MKTAKHKSKSKSKPQKNKKDKPQIRLVESDHPDGPWTEIPANHIRAKELSLDEARSNNPILNWFVPVDLMTELYDESMGVNTGLDSNGLYIIRKRFGQNCTLRDIRVKLESNNINFNGKGWPFILDFAKQLPDDLMTLTVTISKYNVSKITLRRRIKSGDLEEYRLQNKPEILVSEKEVKTFFPLR